MEAHTELIGTVTDLDGRPILDARVTLYNVDLTWPVENVGAAWAAVDEGTVTTDDQGRFTFTGTNATGWLHVQAEGHLACRVFIRNEAGPLQVTLTPRDERFVVAHRAGSDYAPENTMAGVQKSLMLGVHRIEVDVRLSRDDVPVLMHDATLDRTTDGWGRVDALTAAQLAALDAGSWFHPSFAGQGVPTVAQVLQTVAPSPATLILEVKAPAEDFGRVARLVAKTVHDHGMGDRVYLSGFHAVNIVHCQTVLATRCAWLADEPAEIEAGTSTPAAAALDAVHIPSTHASRERIQTAQAYGAQVVVNKAFDPSGWARWYERGANGVSSDAPQAVLDALQQTRGPEP